MQAKVLALLLVQRNELTCTGASSNNVDMICSHHALKSQDSGIRMDRSDFSISIRYVKVCLGRKGVHRATCLDIVVQVNHR